MPPAGCIGSDGVLKAVLRPIAAAVLGTVLACATAVAAACAAVPVGPGVLAASVRDADDRPVAGALVVADGPTQREATTGAAGVVTLQALPVGTYAVRVTRSGFEPLGTTVRVAATREGLHVVSLRLATATFADLRDAASVAAVAALDGGEDPFVAQALEAASQVNLVPGAGRTTLVPVILGTGPGETRSELDGIPFAGGGPALGLLRLLNALDFVEVQTVAAPGLTSPSLHDAIGGIVEYRTPEIERAPAAGAEAGYDSAFGAFQHVRYTQTYGRLGVLADTVTGGGQDRSQTFKARYAFSEATSVAVATYGLQGEGASAPAFAADVRTRVGGATLRVRSFGSELSSPALAGRTRGVQGALDVPVGASSVSFDYDRREERTAASGLPDVARSYATVTARTDVRLSPASRLRLGAASSSGTSLPARLDPQVEFATQPIPQVTVRVSAGSSFATSPDGVLAASSGNRYASSPETSVGYRAALDADVGGGDRVHAAAYELTRFDRFASLANGRARGLELSYDRRALPGRLGASAYLNLTRTYGYGAVQPATRYAGYLPLVAGAQLDGDPYSKARVALAYVTRGSEVRLGTTLVGPGNDLDAGSVALGDASLRFTFFDLADLRVGLENAFGRRFANPTYAALFPPYEFTFTIGRLANRP